MGTKERRFTLRKFPNGGGVEGGRGASDEEEERKEDGGPMRSRPADRRRLHPTVVTNPGKASAQCTVELQAPGCRSNHNRPRRPRR